MAICDVTVVRTDDRALVTLLGEADIANRDEPESSLSEVVATRPGVIEVDLGGLEFIDSTCIAVLMAAFRSAHASGQLFYVTNADGIVARVLEVTGVLPILTKDATRQ
jgi:anti-anti-sigma factor